MIVELGNPAPIGSPGPTILLLEDVPCDVTLGMHAPDLTDRWQSRNGRVASMGEGHRGFTTVLSVWHNQAHTNAERPTWVRCTLDAHDRHLGHAEVHAEELERQLAEHFGCPRGYPDDLEATHHTYAGPPGVGPKESA